MGGYNWKWSLFVKLFKLIVNDVFIVWLWIMNEFKKKKYYMCGFKVESLNLWSWKLDWINRIKYIKYIWRILFFIKSFLVR